MKITFEGDTIRDILKDMQTMLHDADYWKDIPKASAPAPGGAAVAEPNPASAAVIAKSLPPLPPAMRAKRKRTEKQLANDERMRVAALERIAAKRAAKVQQEKYATNLRRDLDRDPIEAKPAPEPTPEPFAEPADFVQLRQDTIKDLQAAYANGHQAEVMELLSRFGDGAKSFRELPPESFVPIRDAINKGALT